MDPYEQGLQRDLVRLIEISPDFRSQRRRALRWLTMAGALGVAGCGGSEEAATGTTTTSTTTGSSTTGSSTTGSTTGTSTTGSGSSSSTASCTVIPEETAGPYPADGSNTANGVLANALALSGIVRSDIRSSIAGATATAAGVPLTMTLKLVNTNGNCAALEGWAIYLWHCDREGRYSMYSTGVTAQNYLRGVQATDANGSVTFTTIFPGCYDGRMPHMHFEVFRSVSTALNWNNKLRTSQIAFPTDICTNVYTNATGYTTSLTNLGRISFATDNVFSDGVTLQLASLTGSIDAGYAATLQVAVSG